MQVVTIEPLQGDLERDALFENHIRGIIDLIGEDSRREGLIETPRRARQAWGEWMSGYRAMSSDVLKVFEDGAPTGSEMVVVADIPVYSHCEHHLAPFFGTAAIGYMPAGRIVGLSKLPRLVDVFARRLQVQERLTSQIASAIDEIIAPNGVAVVLKCRHLCMESRGIRSRATYTTTVSYRGVLDTDPLLRQDFARAIA